MTDVGSNSGPTVGFFGVCSNQRLKDASRKFETMCLEVEEDWQEGYRYMEDQVKMVGENVKQFCTEFATELLPESFLVEDPVSVPSPIQIRDGFNQISVENTERDPIESETCEERVSTEASLMHDKIETRLVEKYSEEKQLNLAVPDKVSAVDNDPIAYPASNSEHRFYEGECITADSKTLVGFDCKQQLDASCILVHGSELAELSKEARPSSFKKKVGSVLLNKRQPSKRGSSEPDSGNNEGVREHVSSKSTTTFHCEEYSESDWEFV